MNHRSFNPPLPKSKYTHIGSLLRHLLTSTETRKMANPSGPPSPPIYESYVSSCQSRVSFCPYPQGPTSAPVGQSLKRPPVPLWVKAQSAHQCPCGPKPKAPTSAPVGQSLKRPPVPLWVYVEGPPQPQNGPFRGGGQKVFLKGRGLWGKVHVNDRTLSLQRPPPTEPIPPCMYIVNLK